MEVFLEVGLLTEAEFKTAVGLEGKILKAEPMSSLPSYLGGAKNQKFFICTLEGLPCDKIHSMRRMRISYKFGLTHEQVLLSAAKNLMAGQGKMTYEFHNAKQVSDRPTGLKDETGRDTLKSLNEWRSQFCVAVDESSEEDGSAKNEKTEKKVQVALASGRLQKAVAPKRLGKAKSAKGQGSVRSAKKDKGRDKEADHVAALEIDDDSLPPNLLAVCRALKSTPRCFLNLSPARILQGEKLMRSVDAAFSRARWVESRIEDCRCECANV